MIDRSKTHVFEDLREEVADQEGSFLMQKVQAREEMGILGLLGVVNIVGCDYLAACTEAELVGELGKSRVYKVAKVELLPFQ